MAVSSDIDILGIGVGLDARRPSPRAELRICRRAGRHEKTRRGSLRPGMKKTDLGQARDRRTLPEFQLTE
jgi:hypothetical protein